MKEEKMKPTKEFEEDEEEKVNDDDVVIEDGTKEKEINTTGIDDTNKNDGDDKKKVATANEEQAQEEGDKRKRKYVAADAPWLERMWEVFTTFWPLGFIAFGGPTAHVALLRDHLVVQRDWVTDDQFQELFAIGQGLPGPSSTQLVVAVALSRAGPLGGMLAFLVWSLPGLVMLTVFGILIEAFIDPSKPPWFLVGLPPAAVALVFVAFHSFAIKQNKLGVVLGLISCCVTILINNDAVIKSTSSQWAFPVMLAGGGLVTFIDSKRAKPYGNYDSPSKGWEIAEDETFKRIGIPLWMGAILFVVWLGILIVTIILAKVFKIDNPYLDITEVMYRIGSIIYGGGQVVLPMLQDEVVPDWMSRDQFLQGLGLATSMPGPLFNFSAYLGAIYKGVPGALLAFMGLMTPGNLLIFAAVPFWAKLRHNRIFRSVLSGVNSAAVGLIGAACVILWESAIISASDAIVFSIAFTLHVSFGLAAPFVIIAGGIVGAILHPDAANLGQVPYCIDQGFIEPTE